MADQIPQHTHCQVCRKATTSAEPFCSDECKTQYEAMRKRNRLWVYVMYALMVFIIIVIVATSFK